MLYGPSRYFEAPKVLSQRLVFLAGPASEAGNRISHGLIMGVWGRGVKSGFAAWRRSGRRLGFLLAVARRSAFVVRRGEIAALRSQ